MAKKKHSAAAAAAAVTATAAAAEAEARKEGAAPPPPAARDPSPEKVESLKSLNHLLLKETVERREQVSQLRSRVDDLAFDHSFLSAADRDVARVVLASHLSDLRSLAAARELAADADARRLKSDLAAAAAEKRAADEEARSLRQTANSLSQALKAADEKLDLAAREKDEIKSLLDSALSEMDSVREDLDRKEKALVESEISNSVVEETLGQVRMKYGECLELIEGKEEALRSLAREKAAIEGKLEEQRQLAARVQTNMDGRIREKQAEAESLVAEKEALEAKVSALEEKYRRAVERNQQLRDEVRSSKDAVDSLRKEVEGTRSKLTEMGESYAKADVECKRLRTEFSSMEKEKEGIQLLFEAEKIEASRELEHLRRRLKETQEEKDFSIEVAKNEKEVEVSNLRDEIEKMRSNASELRVKCRDYGETNIQLRADKDSVRKALDRVESQAEELKKIKNERERELRDAKTNLEEKGEKIEVLSRELEILRLALVEAEKKKAGIWTWLCPATTAVLAAVSFAYATRRTARGH